MTAFNWPAIRSRVTVDGVVAVVDGPAVAAGAFADDPEALAAQRAADPSVDHDNPLEEVFEDQLLCADLILLNKTDLMDARPSAPRVRGEIARAPAPRREGGRDRARPGRSGRSSSASAPRRRRTSPPAPRTTRRRTTTTTTISRASRFPSAPSPRPRRWPRGSARAAEAAGVLRIKGFAPVEGRPLRLVVQGVGRRVAHHFDRPWRPGEARDGRLVVIGLKGFDRAAVEAALAG